MSYWSQRRTAERAAAHYAGSPASPDSHDLASLPEARITLPDWTPAISGRHPATVTSPTRTLRQRAAEIEAKLWTIPAQDPADIDPTYPGGARVRARSSW